MKWLLALAVLPIVRFIPSAILQVCFLAGVFFFLVGREITVKVTNNAEQRKGTVGIHEPEKQFGGTPWQRKMSQSLEEQQKLFGDQITELTTLVGGCFDPSELAYSKYMSATRELWQTFHHSSRRIPIMIRTAGRANEDNLYQKTEVALEENEKLLGLLGQLTFTLIEYQSQGADSASAVKAVERVQQLTRKFQV